MPAREPQKFVAMKPDVVDAYRRRKNTISIAPRSARQQLRREARTRARVPTTSALSWVFAMMAFGMNPQATSDFQRCLGDSPPPKVQQTAAMHRVVDEAIREARDTAMMYRMPIPPGMVLAYDGSWGHRRNADQCFGAFIRPEDRR
jgi:hypothetical protein